MISVTAIVTAYNAAPVIRRVLASLYRQSYPIREILVIDNHSTDDTVDVVRTFAQRYRRVSIRIIERSKTYGLSDSYNLGAKKAKTTHIVTLHADGFLPTAGELTKLIRVFTKFPDAVAAGPRLVHRMEEWTKYPFWQKCLFATYVGKVIPSGNGKFDAYDRRVFLKIGGYDTRHFRHTMGAEDADMYARLEKIGRVVNSEATVIHAHPVELGYTLADWIRRRRYLSLSYGRYLQLHLRDLAHIPYGLFIKPFLAFFSLLVLFHPVFFIPLAVFPFVYMPRMFRSHLTNRDPRILTLPFVLIFLVYYETGVLLYSFWFLRERRI